MKSLEAGKSWHADPHNPVGKAEVVGEVTVKCTSRATAVRIQASRERLAEITSGRATSQQGLAATCKDSPHGRKAEGGERDLVWRMSPYERRRRGNALRDGVGHRLSGGNAIAEQRGSGHLAVPGPYPDTEPGLDGPRSRDEPASKLTAKGVYVSQHLSLGDVRKAYGGKPRSEPDSGNPTVRDRRGAPGNVAMGAGLRPAAKAVGKPPDPKASRAGDLSRRIPEPRVSEAPPWVRRSPWFQP